MAQLKEHLTPLDLAVDEAHIRRLDSISRIDPGFPHDLINSPMADNMFGGLRVDKSWKR